ncbi:MULTISPECIES: hypothetical protein [unclassified Streptomyces]|uniref:hypothetical protein n=1 Tax=unclassified Streptomyces TaxID=2593676 RepID=UPI0036EB044B
MTAEHQGADALMAAITGEPLPEGTDAACLAEHREAAADVALLREQLGLIADALVEPPPAPASAARRVPAVRRVQSARRVPAAGSAPARPSRGRRRTAVRFAFGGLAVAAVASVVAGVGWLAAQGADGIGGSQADSASGAKSQPEADAGTRFGSPYYLACTRLVAEGTVASVERLADGVQLRVVVDVIRYYKQEEKRPERLTYVVEDTFAPGLVRGERVLFGVPQGAAVPDHWVVGEQAVARERAWIQASLPQSRELGC